MASVDNPMLYSRVLARRDHAKAVTSALCQKLSELNDGERLKVCVGEEKEIKDFIGKAYLATIVVRDSLVGSEGDVDVEPYGGEEQHWDFYTELDDLIERRWGISVEWESCYGRDVGDMDNVYSLPPSCPAIGREDRPPFSGNAEILRLYYPLDKWTP